MSIYDSPGGRLLATLLDPTPAYRPFDLTSDGVAGSLN